MTHVVVLGPVLLHRASGIVAGIGSIMSRHDHLPVTEHEPHHIQARVRAMDFSDHLVAHFLVASVEQLGEGGTRYLTCVRKLRIGNPSLFKKHF